MIIYRYDADSETGVSVYDMPDDYTVKTGDFTALPEGYTPYKLVNGVLTASTKEESDAYYKQQGNAPATPTASPETKVMAVMNKQIINLSQQVFKLQSTVQEQTAQIQALQGGNK